MAATPLSVDTMALAAAGVEVTWNTPSTSSGNTFGNTGRAVVLAKNGATASCAVTFAATQTVTGAALSVPDLTVSISASTTIAIGPLPKATFNSGSDVTMSYANDSTLTIAIIKW